MKLFPTTQYLIQIAMSMSVMLQVIVACRSSDRSSGESDFLAGRSRDSALDLQKVNIDQDIDPDKVPLYVAKLDFELKDGRSFEVYFKFLIIDKRPMLIQYDASFQNDGGARPEPNRSNLGAARGIWLEGRGIRIAFHDSYFAIAYPGKELSPKYFEFNPHFRYNISGKTSVETTTLAKLCIDKKHQAIEVSDRFGLVEFMDSRKPIGLFNNRINMDVICTRLKELIE